MVHLRLLRFFRERARVEPDTPHRFRPQIVDPGWAALASSGKGPQAMTGPTQLLVADTYVRKSVCGVPGCGKPRHDPIHEGGDE